MLLYYMDGGIYMKNHQYKLFILQILLVIVAMYNFVFVILGIASFNSQRIPFAQIIESGAIIPIASNLITLLVISVIAFLGLLLLKNLKKGIVFESINIRLFKVLAVISYINTVQLIVTQSIVLMYNPYTINIFTYEGLFSMVNNRIFSFVMLAIMFQVLSQVFTQASIYKHEVDLTV